MLNGYWLLRKELPYARELRRQGPLEVVTAAYLSRCPVLMKEVREFFDFHEDNRQRFALPSRLIAKKFKFRLIYGGTEYSYSVDPDFASVGYSQKKWKEVIDQYYAKYHGLKRWHTQIVQDVIRDGFLLMPTGREFHYEPKKNFRGELEWPRTTILNYPVQGTGADLMALARVMFYNRLKRLKKERGFKAILISTVHDSIVVDCPDNEYEEICELFFSVFDDIPKNFQKMFGVEFDLPMTAEVLYGPNLFDMKECKRQ